ncbi:hypothetical protein [Rhodohalobacter sp. 8-1]|uniref:hypothetical protein n=1 Tax=Rhodohalobacter sp. 8-1 TaxID=3131972 RepID=UPI0030EDFEEE
MESFLGFWSFIIFLTIIIIGVPIFLAYWIPKRYGNRKLGVGLAIVVALIFATPILSFVLEDYLFFKSDAAESLKEHGIILQDDFYLESNKMTGIGDFYHRFVLEISKNDKNRLSGNILNSVNYKDSISDTFDIRSGKPRYSDTTQDFIVTYQDKWSYVYEYYELNKKGKTPTWDRISISKKENELIYERILD